MREDLAKRRRVDQLLKPEDARAVSEVWIDHAVSLKPVDDWVRPPTPGSVQLEREELVRVLAGISRRVPLVGVDADSDEAFFDLAEIEARVADARGDGSARLAAVSIRESAATSIFAKARQTARRAEARPSAALEMTDEITKWRCAVAEAFARKDVDEFLKEAPGRGVLERRAIAMARRACPPPEAPVTQREDALRKATWKSFAAHVVRPLFSGTTRETLQAQSGNLVVEDGIDRLEAQHVRLPPPIKFEALGWWKAAEIHDALCALGEDDPSNETPLTFEDFWREVQKAAGAYASRKPSMCVGLSDMMTSVKAPSAKALARENVDAEVRWAARRRVRDGAKDVANAYVQ